MNVEINFSVAILLILITFVVLLFSSRTFSRLWFAEIYKHVVTPFLEIGCDHIRKTLLSDISNLQAINHSEQLNVLEVGAAYGLNFKFYPQNCRLTVLEINNFFEKYYNQNQSTHPQITFDRFIVGNGMDMKEFEDNSFDVVVATLYLCSVRNPYVALKEIKRVLKKGGTYYFLEHIGYPGTSLSHRFMYAIQVLLTPFWRTFLEGCRLCRHQQKIIKSGGFDSYEFNFDYPKAMLPHVRAMLWGKAIK